MKILVTGGAGFIGSHVTEAYLSEGHDVTVLDDLSTGKKRNVPAKARLVTADVRDPNLSTLFAESRFEIVNHLAAQIDVRKSVLDPFFDASVNILGTMRLLECGRAYGVRKFLYSSTGGAFYGECPGDPADENSPGHPESPYGLSKATAERYIQFYGSLYRLPYTILRYGNVYGPRQDPHGEAGVIAIFAGKLLSKEPVTIYGNGNQERDYVYVADVVAANISALTKGENTIFNIGTGTPTSVNTLYQKMSSLESNALKANAAPARPGELARSVLNSDRAQKVLGWKPKFTLDQGLKDTYQFFLQQKKAIAGKS